MVFDFNFLLVSYLNFVFYILIGLVVCYCLLLELKKDFIEGVIVVQFLIIVKLVMMILEMMLLLIKIFFILVSIYVEKLVE